MRLYTVADLLLRAACDHGAAPAVIDGTSTTSYEDLADRAQRFAGYLARSTDPGERIALLLPRAATTIAMYFGAQMAALVPVFVHEQLRPRQVAKIIGDAQATLVVTTSRLCALLSDCLDSGLIDPAQIVNAEAVDGPPLTPPRRSIGLDLAGLVYTSGSTGAAKGVMLSHRNLIAGAEVVADYLSLMPTDRTLAVLPWSFDYGLNQVLATFAAGGAVVVQRSVFPADICTSLRDHGVTGFAGTPTLWAALAHPASPFLRKPFPALRYLTNSGGALPPSVIHALRAAHPSIDMYPMYGLTEAFRSTFLHPARVDAKPGSIGQAIPGSEVLIIGDHGAVCPPGMIGQIVHRGPTVAAGYWRDPEATAAVFRTLPAALHRGTPREIAVFSGDYGYTDSDGDLYYTGRRDEMFKSRGIRVTPTEIETELLASGLVAAAVVIAVHNDSGEPVILGAVQPAGQAFSLDELDDYCRRELPGHLRPHHLVLMEQMPCTPHGKADRILIGQQLAAHLSGQVTP